MVECPRAQNPGKCGTRAKQRCGKAAARQRGVGSCEPAARLLRRSEAGLARAGDRAAAGISPFQRRRWRSALVGLGLARQAAALLHSAVGVAPAVAGD